MFLFSSSILLLNLATNHSICKGEKLFILPYRWINIDYTRVFLEYQTWNTVLIQKKKDSPSPVFKTTCQTHRFDYPAWNHSSNQVPLLKIAGDSRKSNAQSNATSKIAGFGKNTNKLLCYFSHYPINSVKTEPCWKLTKGPCFKPSCNPLAWRQKVAYLLW